MSDLYEHFRQHREQVERDIQRETRRLWIGFWVFLAMVMLSAVGIIALAAYKAG